MGTIAIHPRIRQRHPEISDDDVLSAWGHAIVLVRREAEEKDFNVAVGSDAYGRLIEAVAALAFHPMTPPSRKTLAELGLTRR